MGKQRKTCPSNTNMGTEGPLNLIECQLLQIIGINQERNDNKGDAYHQKGKKQTPDQLFL
jgi:hypothetical protein